MRKALAAIVWLILCGGGGGGGDINSDVQTVWSVHDRQPEALYAHKSVQTVFCQWKQLRSFKTKHSQLLCRTRSRTKNTNKKTHSEIINYYLPSHCLCTILYILLLALVRLSIAKILGIYIPRSLCLHCPAKKKQLKRSACFFVCFCLVLPFVFWSHGK